MQQHQELELRKKIEEVNMRKQVLVSQDVHRCEQGEVQGGQGGEIGGQEGEAEGMELLVTGLAQSGATLLTEMGLDQNTTQFITAQALRAKNKTNMTGVTRQTIHASRSASLPREIGVRAKDSGPIVSGSLPGSQDLGHWPGFSTATRLRNDVTSVSNVNSATHQRNPYDVGVHLQGSGDRNLQDDHEDSELAVDIVHEKRKLKSGMVAIPTENIKCPQIWPHYNLTYGYVTAAIQYHQISFEQYIAGECKTISNAEDPLEVKGRLSLMSRISYLKQKGHPWTNLRTLYAAIVNHIEKQESTWASDWRDIEDMVLETSIRSVGEKGTGKVSKSTKGEQWYCGSYNRPEGCQLQLPHEATIGKRRRTVKHFCAKCWIEEQEV